MRYGPKLRVGMALVALTAVVMVGCVQSKSAEPFASEKLAGGDVALVATAPDGTRLWGVKHDGRTIYFASTGTDANELCGKNCNYERTTPTYQGSQP